MPVSVSRALPHTFRNWKLRLQDPTIDVPTDGLAFRLPIEAL